MVIYIFKITFIIINMIPNSKFTYDTLVKFLLQVSLSITPFIPKYISFFMCANAFNFCSILRRHVFRLKYRYPIIITHYYVINVGEFDKGRFEKYVINVVLEF